MMRILPQRALLIVLATLVGACSTVESVLPDRRPDYRQGKVLAPLEVPPDLTASTIDDTLMVPELNPTGSASLSDYASERTHGGQVTTGETVLPDQPSIRLERDGAKHWLVTDQEADKLWPRIKEFWTSNGFILKKDDPRIGIMETDWAENRADIPEGPIRSVLKKFLDVAYSAPTRDKFRVRLERVSNTTTEIYLTHYGVEEIGTGGVGQRQGETFLWQPRPSDPELEAEMLSRLMVYLGASEKRAEAQLAKASTASQAPKVQLVDRAGQQALVIEEGYSRAWRLVGLALDGSDFVVEDQNRAQGLYLVEYRDTANEGKDQGFLSGLAFWKGKPRPQQGMRYQVRLAGQGSQTLVVVQNAQGQPDNSPTAQLILKTLQETIK